METKTHLHSTKKAFVLSRLLNVPFWVLFNLLPIILYKELHISPWMITALIVIKPASALFATYWSSWIHERQDRLVNNIILANLLRYIPFLFVPWIDSPWIFMGAFGLYMMLSRGVIPAWMEIFKLNLDESDRPKVFAFGSSLDYFATAALPILLGLLLDDYAIAWRLLFPLTATLGLLSTLFLLKLPNRDFKSEKIEKVESDHPFLHPWKQALRLMKTRPDFFRFQIGFMLGGAGLMVMQPVLPLFFVDVLNLSYTKMMLALGAAKAVGFALASPFWSRLFDRWNIFLFSGVASLLAALFPFMILTSVTLPSLIYVAYFLYGIMQAASELSWHLSGPVFSEERESSPYSMTNVLFVGVRGCVAPIFGSLLFAGSSSSFVLIIGALLCLLSAWQLISTAADKRAIALD